MATHYLACDLGAESGRVMLATLDAGKIALEELHRFPNRPVKRRSGLHWDFPRLLAELATGLKKAAARNLPIASISTDSWGVDYVLYDAKGQPAGQSESAKSPGSGVAAILAPDGHFVLFR